MEKEGAGQRDEQARGQGRIDAYSRVLEKAEGGGRNGAQLRVEGREQRR
jgi:hypothetical protein